MQLAGTNFQQISWNLCNLIFNWLFKQGFICKRVLERRTSWQTCRNFWFVFSFLHTQLLLVTLFEEWLIIICVEKSNLSKKIVSDSALIWFERSDFSSQRVVFQVKEWSRSFKAKSGLSSRLLQFFKEIQVILKIKIFIYYTSSEFDIIWEREKRENNQETYQT